MVNFEGDFLKVCDMLVFDSLKTNWTVHKTFKLPELDTDIGLGRWATAYLEEISFVRLRPTH